jgi:hypothetical protein
VHRGHRTDLPQFLQEPGGREVSDVQDQARALQEPDTRVRQPPSAAWEMRVSDERDQLNSARKLPSR